MQEFHTEMEFNKLVAGINWTDAFVRECYCTSPEFVFRAKADSEVVQTLGEGGFNVRLLLMLGLDEQVAAVELLFEHVGQIVVSSGMEINLSCTIDEWQKTVYLSKDKSHFISGSRLSCGLLDESSWGPKLRYGSHLPVNNAISATPIEELWRLCSECSEAWKESPQEIFSICPNCLCMTKIAQIGPDTQGTGTGPDGG